MDTSKYKKLRLHLRAWFQGRAEDNPDYYRALEALEFAEKIHNGVRKNGFTPEFQHQMEITQRIRVQSRYLRFPVQTFVVALCHDVMEPPYNVSMQVMTEKFGLDVAEPTWRVTKKQGSLVKAKGAYFSEMSECPIASVIKGWDRVNNIQTMLGVFKLEKQQAYMQEVRDDFLPMLKRARRLFPDQEAVYENIKFVLESQLEIYDALHAVSLEGVDSVGAPQE